MIDFVVGSLLVAAWPGPSVEQTDEVSYASIQA